MTVVGIVGKPGNGKNCLATRLLLRHVQAECRLPESQRRTIWANFPVFDRAYTLAEIKAGDARLLEDVQRFDDWDQVKRASSAIVFLDEAYQVFNSRQWSKCDPADIAQWTQHRKHGLTMYWIAQGVNQIESTIRLNVTAKIWSVVRMMGPAWDEGNTPLEDVLGVWSVARQWDADAFETPTKARCLATKPFRIDKYFGMFDTTWNIANRAGEGGGMGAGLAGGSRQAGSLATLSAVEAYKKWRVPDEFGHVRFMRPCDVEVDAAMGALVTARIEQERGQLGRVSDLADPDALNRTLMPGENPASDPSPLRRAKASWAGWSQVMNAKMLELEGAGS